MDEAAVEEVKEYIRMNAGDGKFSYARNTVIQETSANRTKPIIEKAVHSILSEEIVRPGDQVLMSVADLGCGLGPVPLSLISTLIEHVRNVCKALKWSDDHIPTLQILFNDLPLNDFYELFKDVAKLQLDYQKRGVVPSCFSAYVPGSFHARLFPANSLHLVHSHYALHWLSQIPPGLINERWANTRNIHLCERSPPITAKAYLTQFQKDWTSFLTYRSAEVVPGGRMVLVIRGRPSKHLQPGWELMLLGRAIATLVSQGLIKEEKLDTLNIPIYFPSQEELQEIVETEGSFDLEHIDTFVYNIAQETRDKHERAEIIGKCIRGFTETLVSHHLGEQVVSVLYDELTRVSFEFLSTEQPVSCSIIVMLKRRSKSKN